MHTLEQIERKREMGKYMKWNGMKENPNPKFVFKVSIQVEFISLTNGIIRNRWQNVPSLDYTRAIYSVQTSYKTALIRKWLTIHSQCFAQNSFISFDLESRDFKRNKNMNHMFFVAQNSYKRTNSNRHKYQTMSLAHIEQHSTNRSMTNIHSVMWVSIWMHHNNVMKPEVCLDWK